MEPKNLSKGSVRCFHHGERRKGGFGRFLGAITGTPYERLLKQVDKLVNEFEDDDRKLAKNLNKLAKMVGEQYEEENLDEEEHDLILEAIEEVDPEGRSFAKLSDDEDSFYAGTVPDAPELKREKRTNLDDLMQSKGDEFLGSYGRDEFEEFKARMSDDFIAESDDAIRQGDHQAEIITENRVFADADEELDRLKQQISQESGMVDPNAEEEKRKKKLRAIQSMKTASNGSKTKTATGGSVKKAKTIGNLTMKTDLQVLVQ